MVLKTIFWPFYFVVEKSPLERLSEAFFRNYGNKDVTYRGTRGLKNFLRDVFLGKNRYQGLVIEQLHWVINPENAHFKEYCLGKDTYYANILYTKKHDQYLLRIVIANSIDQRAYTRFDLDECFRLNVKEFIKELVQINSQKAKNLCKQLSIE